MIATDLKRLLMEHQKRLGEHYVSLRQVLLMMSKDWSVLLILLTVVLLVFWNFVMKAGDVDTFITR